MIELKCQNCGETFVAKRGNAKWCSERCCDLNRRPSLGSRQFKCQNCGDIFVAKRRDAKWCSGTCSKMGALKNNPERHTKQKAYCRDYQQQFRSRNPALARQRSQAWREANPDKSKLSGIKYERKRRAEKADGAMNIYLNTETPNDR